MHRLIQKVKHIKGTKKFSYWTNSKKEYSQIYVFLPPGAESGEFFRDLVDKVSDNTLIIAIDYPARGKTTPTGKNDVISIAEEVVNYLKFFKFDKKIHLVGLSYGSAVAIEMCRIEECLFRELILIAPGEYIPKKYHFLIYTLFFPAKFSRHIRRWYRKFLVKFLPNIFTGFPKRNLKDILYQWLGILEYKIDETYNCNISCKIVAFSHDQIIRKGSILKVKKCFPNSLILLEIKDHHLDVSTLSKRILDYILLDR